MQQDYDPEKWLKAQSSIADKALLKACQCGNATALATYFKLTNRLVDKQEIKHSYEPTAEEYGNIANRVITGLRNHFTEHGGVCPICSKSALLLDEVRENKGQERDNTVVSLEAPDIPF